MAGTTSTGIPYPTGTDRVADGDNAMQAIAETLDAGRRHLVKTMTADFAHTGTAPVSVPELAHTVTSAGPSSMWEVTLCADWDHSGGTASQCGIYVDGVAAGGGSVAVMVSTTGMRVQVSKTWLVTGLAAGARAITLRINLLAAGPGMTYKATHTQAIYRQVK